MLLEQGVALLRLLRRFLDWPDKAAPRSPSLSSRPPTSPPRFDPRHAIDRIGPINAPGDEGAPRRPTCRSPSAGGEAQAPDIAAPIIRPPTVDPKFAIERVGSAAGRTRPNRTQRSPKKELSEDELWRRFAEAVDPHELEGIVLEAYQRLGYHVRATPKSGDDGLDGVLFKEDTAIGIQVKRWRNSVTGPQMREFLGALSFSGLTTGHFLTTGKVSSRARLYAEKAGVVIMEGLEVKALLLTHARNRVLTVVRLRG